MVKVAVMVGDTEEDLLGEMVEDVVAVKVEDTEQDLAEATVVDWVEAMGVAQVAETKGDLVLGTDLAREEGLEAEMEGATCSACVGWVLVRQKCADRCLRAASASLGCQSRSTRLRKPT